MISKLLKKKRKRDTTLKVEAAVLTKYQMYYDFSKRKLLELKPKTKATAKNAAEERVEKVDKASDYIISEELINAVNAAIVTGRPLLLKGEPGCGKTKLAKAVATHFFKGDTYKYYFEWFVKSKSTAKEGCYSFDQIQRLRDATVAGKGDTKTDASIQADKYLTLGPLGKALVSKPTRNRKSVLLIDEIDKGDIDFPNDLLLELDELRFNIKEKGNLEISATDDRFPLVFITSNDERELPPAFLRRCLLYRIPPFDKDMLDQIAQGKMESLYNDMKINKKLQLSLKGQKAVVEKFMELRNKTAADNPPSTSELLDWMRLIAFKVHRGENFIKAIGDEKLQQLALKLM